MYLSIWTTISSWVVEFFENFKAFVIENSRNPVMWIGFVIIGLLVFEFVYNALHRD